MERKSVIEAIQHWANQEPERTALWDAGVATSYSVFWQRVQSVAAALQELGCGREDCVAVYMERSTDAVVAIYGALACGSAFVPVDPASGRQRIDYVLENCQAKAILTAGNVPQTTRPVLDVRRLSPAPFCPPVRKGEDLAYVIYTSGTTGKPKGVMIEEHSLRNHLDSLEEEYHFAPGHTIPLLTSHCFDFAIPMLFSLSFGMTLLLFPDALAMGDYLVQGYLNYLKITPSHFMAAANALKKTAWGKVGKVLLGGEAVTEAVCAKAREVFGPQVRIFNEYGPTEATVYTTITELRQGDPVSIGKPCAGSSVYILDGQRLCAQGELGELCFAGPNLARGYLGGGKNNDSFCLFQGVRIYRTGDLGYIDHTGNIFYAGRRDKQVKIRGYRVELEELAEVLRHQPGVSDAAVIAVRSPNGEQELHCYVVGEGPLELSVISRQLQDELPSYMLPAAMMQLSAIPLTANGKLDEGALPEIHRQRSLTPPETPEEARLCTLFAQQLCLEKVGIDENFFVLGGNSLGAMRLVYALTELGASLRLGDVFAHPTVRELARLLGESQGESAPILPAPEQKDYPLSPAQAQMYWFYRLDPTSLSYHMPWCVDLEEGVEPEDIQRAMQAMTDRHEILRTRFIERDGAFRQEVLPHVQVDISLVPEETVYNEAVLQDFLRPFVLEQPPLFRLKLLKQKTGWLLLTDMHHIIRDGLSRDIFIEEYIALREGRTLPEARLQYKDYCQWLEGCELSSQRKFWLEQYHQLPQPLELPTDFPRPAVRSYVGSCVHREIPPSLRETLRNLGKKSNTTDYMLFLSGAMILLGHYARQEDVVIGSPLSGRTHEDLGQLLGIFINTLPLRGYPVGSKTLRQFLQEVRTLCVGAYAHQEYPLSRLVDECGAARESSRNPLFDVILVLQNREHKHYTIAGHQARRIPVHLGRSKVDLTFQILEFDDNFEIELEYSTELFSETSASRMLEHYLTVLKAMGNGLDRPLQELLPLPQGEKQQILKKFNPPFTENSLPTVVQSFSLEAAAHPQRIALRDGAREWTFALFQEKVARLAGRLQAEGLGPGRFATLLCHRSAEYLLGVMAVLHCGAAFVPVDPDYPRERMEYILSDSDSVLVLTDREELDCPLPVVLLSEEVEGEPLPLVTAPPESPAYMIYTSGTTGRPKGVMIPNRALSSYISYAGAHYRDGDAPLEVALFSSISFDLTITSTFLGLLHGGTTTVYPQSPDLALGQILRENRTTFLKLTPAHLKMMEELPWEGKSALRHMVLGGEALSTSLAQRAQHRYGRQLAIHNEYGPTEATVGCCDYIYDEARDRETAVSIGRPMEHVQIYILRDTRLCPIGMPGELCIAGSGVALGYRNQEELTAKAFIPNPFGPGLLYRTGDLARWGQDGRLDFLGRIDNQVKIRGYRIEPEEVQKVLAGLPGVQTALVVANVAPGEEAVLCGYVVSPATLDTEELKQRLAQTLPAYMIPQFLMQLPAIPLTINGKVDRAALPLPQRQGSRRRPETSQECLVCALVEELLGLEGLSPEEDFFVLGGNSLKLMTLRLRLESRTGKAVSLTELYRDPRLGAMAEHLEKAEMAVEKIQLAPTRERYPMSGVQQRLYASYLADPALLAYNHPMGISIRGALDVSRMEQAIAVLLQRHEALRTRYDGRWQYVEQVAFTLPCKKCPGGDEKALLADFVAPFRLEEAPLLRAELLELGEGRWLLLLDVHHIAADGISKSLLMQELSALYNGKALAPATLQYKDYSEWLLSRPQPQASAFWEEMRGGEPTELIYDKPGTQHLRRTAADCTLSLGQERSSSLRRLCAAQGVTPYMFFLGLWSRLLGAYARKEDVTLGSSFAGRTHPALEQTVGMFVHTLLLRTHPAMELSFTDYLQELRELCRQAQQLQDESEDALREAMASCKLFYAFEDVPTIEFSLDGAQCRIFRPEEGEIPFDMTLLVEDGVCYGLKLQYCTALFSEHTARGMLEKLLGLVDAVLQRPNIPLRELPLVTLAEEKLLQKFNATEREFDREITIARRFEAIAARYPRKTAVVYGQDSLSYEELDARANGIAHWLCDRGVGAGSLVALLCENSMERLLAVWGVIKAGAAYVPMEPDFPPERIANILQDSQPAALLFYGTAPETNIPLLDLRKPPQTRRNAPAREQKQTDPLYCIYTSGTTGTPKGVLLSNRGLINLVNYYEHRLGFGPEDRVLQFASYCFDASVSEMLMALAFGGTCVLTPDALRHDSRGLSRYCLEQGVTVATFPPNLYAQMEPFPARLLLTAGSPANPAIVERGAQKGSYMNAYGPTEASICSTDWLYDPADPIPQRVPIGKPIDNVKVYIFQGQRLCGLGVPGELCVAGDSLALEYLHRPALTAEKFIKNPFGSGRLYRTGDLARWLPDGNIDYLGRQDDQVKLRGFRIELQEISSCMLSLPNIRQAAVRLISPEEGSPFLCAYYVSKEPLQEEALRELLGKYLPGYMIPDAYVSMEALPLNTSGKVDIKKLPMPRLGGQSTYLPPETAAQQTLCSLFEELLQLQPVSREDDFFLLGGQSLKAMLLMNRIEECFGIRPSFGDILQNPTPCRLEALLQAGGDSYSPIPQAPLAESYPASPVQARFYSMQKAQPQSVAYNVPFCLRLEGDRSRVAPVLNQVFSAHEAFRTSFAIETGQVVQKLSPFRPVAFPERELEAEESVDDALKEFVRPFDMEEAPLARGCVVTKGKEAWLLLDMHHSIIDGVSTRILSQEFNALYSGKTIEAPRQYHDYSLWDYKRDKSAQKEFWEAALSGELPQIALPYRNREGGTEGAVHKERLSPALTRAVQELARTTGTTEYMLLLAAVMVVLARYSDTQDVTVGSPVANRLHTDTANMIGMFVNTLIMRAHPKSDGSFMELLKEVRGFTLQALEYQDYPLDAVVDHLRSRGVYEEAHFLPVMFSMQEPTKLVFAGRDFRAESREVSTGEGKFDLAIDVLTEKDGYVFSMDYRSARLSRESICRFFGHVEQVLKTVTAHPETRLADIPLLTDRERSRILDIFNHTPHV